jgi:hypothetical protein
MRATRILFVLLGLACITGLSLSACSDDDSGGKGTDKDPATGDGDGDGDGDDGEGDNDDGDGIIIPGADAGTDGDGDGDDGDAQCQDGQTQECTCPDGASKGEQYCFQGMYQAGCTNCPCNDGDMELCTCGQGGAPGTHVCEGSEWTECSCPDLGDGGVLPPCPANMQCQNLAPVAMGGACVDPTMMGNLPIPAPPQCTDVSECTAAGYDNAVCTKIMTISDLLGGAKFCVQQCTPEMTTPGGP